MKSPFHRLLLATEHTDFDSGAEALALALAQRCGLPLAVVLPMLSNAEFEMLAPELALQADAATARRIEQLQVAAQAFGVVLSPRVRRGADLAAEIVAEATAAAADLLVLRRRGQRSFLSRLLVGEMVSQVVARAPCNVLVVPRAALLWRTRVMVGVDPLAPDAACVAFAAALAAAFALPLHLVCVVADASSAAQSLAAVAQATAVQLAQLRHREVTAEVLVGSAADALLAAAARCAADLLVVSRNRPGADAGTRMGRVTEAVTGHAQVAVLVHAQASA
jgi:nucleotide-binding universal stress UspA family protein